MARDKISIQNEIKEAESELDRLKIRLDELKKYINNLNSVSRDTTWIPNDLENGLKNNIMNGLSGNSGFELANLVNQPLAFFRDGQNAINTAIQVGNEDKIKLEVRILRQNCNVVRLRYELKRAIESENTNF